MLKPRLKNVSFLLLPKPYITQSENKQTNKKPEQKFKLKYKVSQLDSQTLLQIYTLQK